MRGFESRDVVHCAGLFDVHAFWSVEFFPRPDYASASQCGLHVFSDDEQPVAFTISRDFVERIFHARLFCYCFGRHGVLTFR